MVKKVQVKWLEKRQFVGIDSSKHSVVMSSHDEENNVGMSPSELLMVALAGCTCYDVLSILEKKRKQVTALTVSVSGVQDNEPPWPYRELRLHYEIHGKGLTDKAVEDAIRISEEKYCSVAATVRGVAAISYDYTIVNEE
jgi:putative redox protein